MNTAIPSSTLTHFDASGQAHMVDVGQKSETHRVAVAMGHIRMSAAAFEQLQPEYNKKGDVLAIARIAAISGCKQTSQLIPLCHPLGLTRVAVDFIIDASVFSVSIQVTAETFGRTGVEMEALTGATVGLLTIYDMLKAVDKGMCIEQVHLLSKSGGKSGDWIHSNQADE